MADRSTYLARTLIKRLGNLNAHFLDDAAPDLAEVHRIKLETVAKVLAVEEGITDGPTIALALSGAPNVDLVDDPTTREVEEYAAFLRGQLKLA